MDPVEGQMTEAPTSENISTQLHRIATRAREMPGVALRTLAQFIDIAFLREAHRRTRKDGAVGVDRQTAEDYATELESNLQRLLDRAKSGIYRAPPVRRVHIPKGDGSERRPIGIPTFEDKVLQRADRNPNTQGCLDLGMGRSGMAEILAACRAGSVKALVLQGPELLRTPEAVDALSRVPFVAVMATHEGPELDRAHVVLPAAMWAEVEGTFTNYQRRVQRIKRAFPPPGDARPMWELAAGLLQRLGHPLAATSAREVFGLLAKAVTDYLALDYRALGATGRVLPLKEEASAAAPA